MHGAALRATSGALRTGTLLMTSSRHLTPPRVPTGSAVAASVFAAYPVERLRNMEQGRRKATFVGGENESGRVAATDTAGQEPFTNDMQSVVSCKSMPPRRHETEEVMNASFAAGSVNPDVSGHYSRGRVCPLCNSPVDRVRRRILDRLVSWISPVYRYRCRMKGWGCDWEGNLRTKRQTLAIRGPR